jgi:aspartyl-tRNA(Asn)/glutamyl-tRNA(Gln) amidotransferase subunit A
MDEITNLRTISDAAAALSAGQTTVEALVQQALDKAASNAELNAIAVLDTDRALGLARERDRELAVGELRGPLHGIPITVKDLFAVAGLPTSAGTRVALPELGRSTAVARLEAAGAVIFAKANMHEIALGLTGENGWTGDVKNPHDPERQAGGSSSGSAVAVAVGAGFASLGTDTGGSIRTPAALCGVTGFKPSHGLVPLDGALALSPTCDHAGPITTTVGDARAVTEVLAGGSLRPTLAGRPELGVPRAYLEGRLTRAMRQAFDDLLARLRDAGAVLRDVEVEALELTAAAYTPLVRAEAAFVHRRSISQAPDGFSPPVRAALEAGTRLPAVEYLEARATRRRVIQGLRQAFGTSAVDALILPSTPSAALRRGETMIELESGQAVHRDAQLALTAPFSLAGVPTAAVPFGKIDGLPVGVQLVSAWDEDARALDVADWVEGAVR